MMASVQILETKTTSKTCIYSKVKKRFIWEKLTFDKNQRFARSRQTLTPAVAVWNVKRNRITGRRETNIDGTWFHKILDKLSTFSFSIVGMCRNKPFFSSFFVVNVTYTKIEIINQPICVRGNIGKGSFSLCILISKLWDLMESSLNHISNIKLKFRKKKNNNAPHLHFSQSLFFNPFPHKSFHECYYNLTVSLC